MDRLSLRLDEQDPYVSLHFIMIFVRDQERSLRFYLDQLRFRLVVDERVAGSRWIEVAPPDGSASLALAQAPADSVAELVGRDTRIYFITEDIQAKYDEWNGRGVRFEFPPRKPPWGGIFTRFEDPDGNSFGLAGFDELTLGVEMRRRALAQKLEAERQAERELEIARQVQTRLLPQRMPEARTLDYAGACLPARQVGGDYYDFLDLGHRRLGLVIGDIAGKGIAAALLMANLQANLRSQCATAAEEPNQFLRSLNQLFFENTADGDYATFFFSEYDDVSRRFATPIAATFLLCFFGEVARLSGSTPPPRSLGSSTNGTALSKNASYSPAIHLFFTPTAQPNPSAIPAKSSVIIG
jgi:predicted enzyme related to lactoylglutathione lyase